MDVRPIKTPPEEVFSEFYLGFGRQGTFQRPWLSVKIPPQLLKDKEIGKLIVPIVPDEAQIFGMEALFRQLEFIPACVAI